MDDFMSKPITFKQLSDLDKSEKLKSIKKTLDEIADDNSESSTNETAETSIFTVENSDPTEATIDSSVQYCLIASGKDSVDVEVVERVARKNDWNTVKVDDGEHLLRMLKTRNWDAVILDESLPKFSPAQCMGRFREWEELNRINRQRNVVLWSGSCSPLVLGSTSKVQLPRGFDLSLGKPTKEGEVDDLFVKASRYHHGFQVRNIITRKQGRDVVFDDQQTTRLTII
jgi:CheY-like chemotaxis protein